MPSRHRRVVELPVERPPTTQSEALAPVNLPEVLERASTSEIVGLSLESAASLARNFLLKQGYEFGNYSHEITSSPNSGPLTAR